MAISKTRIFAGLLTVMCIGTTGCLVTPSEDTAVTSKRALVGVKEAEKTEQTEEAGMAATSGISATATTGRVIQNTAQENAAIDARAAARAPGARTPAAN